MFCKCDTCGYVHKKYDHWGCNYLLDHVLNRINCKIHLYGHVHDDIGFKTINNKLFVNSAMDIYRRCHRIKCIFDLEDNIKINNNNSNNNNKSKKRGSLLSKMFGKLKM